MNEDDYSEYFAERNSILHSFIDCEKYRDYRVKLIPKIVNSDMENSFYYHLNNLNEAQARKLIILIKIILNDKDN